MKTVRGFSLIEVLVAVAIFALLSAMTWGGLSTIMRSRAVLEASADRLKHVQLTVAAIERDLRQAVARPVRGNYGQSLAALTGSSTVLELSHGAFARTGAEARAKIARTAYTLDAAGIRRNTYAVLDRAQASRPVTRVLVADVTALRFRYLGPDGNWRDEWPPRDGPPPAPEALPRAVEFRFASADYGDIVRLVELPDGEAPAVQR
ncbi:MAG TPA: type II secretion system minor pseudopilin GspJ [Xanthomonadales bacterium]|nr:type II secretion system minor pseudopilin GspJ [Xanthomonadales bacterium]